MIYFDNAATTFPKPEGVINELNKCVKTYCGNPGRSSHHLSVKSAEAIYQARENVACILGINTPENIVFTYNATHALNMAIKTLINDVCHVLTSDFEHNSVIRPLESLKKSIGISYSSFSTDGDVQKNICDSIRSDTKAIVSSICSNVSGREISAKMLSKIATRYNLILIIDASQAVGHSIINLENTRCDALCAPGHKALFGIQGSGFAYFKNNIRTKSYIEGGSGVDSRSPEMPLLLPEAYEAGTLATPAICTLSQGINFIKEIGIDNIKKKLIQLTDYSKNLISDIPGVKVISSENGIISFNINNIHSSIISRELDKYNICTRSGLHCAPSIHQKMGTISQGVVRLSFSYFNSKKEIDSFAYRLNKIAKSI